jgi:hypothetical protein
VTSTPIAGLTNGTTYTFKVKAINVVGPGPDSAASNAVTPTAAAVVPGAPTGVTATAGNASATVSWSAPASNGGSAITGYTVTPYVGVTAQTSTTVGNVTSTQIASLTNGTTYTFKVRAINAVGPGPDSTASNAVTPTAGATAPGAPTAVTAAPGDASATVSWTAPASNGGSPITGYTVTPYVGATAQTPTTVANVTSTPMAGLTNGTTYTFKVKATNAIGTGPESAASNAVTPSASPTVPGAPTNATATAGDASASVSWTAPASDGGSAITGYTVTPYVGNVAQTPTTVGFITATQIAGLTNGTTYTFKVKATNAVGTGPDSAASNAVTPTAGATAPGAPTNVSASALDAAAIVSWSAPASNGGSPITGYTVTPYIGPTPQTSTTVGNVLSTQVSFLSNGTTYTFKVRAINAIGPGPDSAASSAVTPHGDQPPGPRAGSDFDGDQKTDLGALYRGRSPQDSLFFAPSSSGGGPFQIFFGATTDIPVVGDYNGDGKTDAVIYRPGSGLWYGPATGLAQIVIQMTLGQSGDIPIPGDYDGDGKTDPAIYRPSTGLFFAVLSGGGTKSQTFGVLTDVPVPKDYDGDGKTDFAIYRQDATPDHLGLWYAPLSGGGIYQIYFGAPGDVPVPGDYNGDGRAEAVIFRAASGLWYGPFNGAPGLFQLLLGANGDSPIPGYYDNNLAVDPAIYRKSNGLWFALLSGGGTARIDGLGLSTDVPLQKRPTLAGGI